MNTSYNLLDPDNEAQNSVPKAEPIHIKSSMEQGELGNTTIKLSNEQSELQSISLKPSSENSKSENSKSENSQTEKAKLENSQPETSHTENPETKNPQSTSISLKTDNESSLSAIQMANSEEEIIDNIVKQTTDTAEDEKQILDELETMDPALFLEMPSLQAERKKMKLAKMFFFASLILLGLVLLFYGGGASSKSMIFNSTDTKMTEIKKNNVVNNLVITSLAVDNLALATYENNQTEMKNQLGLIKSTLEDVSLATSNDVNINTILLDYLTDNGLETEHRIFIARSNLNINLEADVFLESKKVMEAFHTPVSKIVLSEQSRINWVQVLEELQVIFQEFDSSFNVLFPVTKQIISINNYSFSQDTQSVIIGGAITTKDSKTFTLITEIVDRIEQSPLFSNVVYNNYNKAFNTNENAYKTELNLNFNLAT